METVFAVVARVLGRDLQGGGDGPTLRLSVSELLHPLPQQQHQQMQISEISPIKNPNPASSPVSMSSDRKVLVDYKYYIYRKKLMYLILSFYNYKYIPKSDSNHA